MISFSTISKSYTDSAEAVRVLDSVSLEVAPKTFGAICGPSGCGKSTLLLILGGLLRPDAGEVMLAGHSVWALSPKERARLRAQSIGFVFQRFHLVPYLTVAENIQAASLALGVPDDAERVHELMEEFGLLARANHIPGRLSVGEQQRTALARALFNRPKVLLADEPTGNLDADNAAIVLNAFSTFAAAGGTVLMVSHHKEAVSMADCVWTLNRGRVVS